MKIHTGRRVPRAAVAALAAALTAAACGASASAAHAQASATFSLVSVMHGKCVTANLIEVTPAVTMTPCQGPAASSQRWTYSATTGELRIDTNKCMESAGTATRATIRTYHCNGSSLQKWDIDARGRLVLRGILSPEGATRCPAIANGNRADGAGIWLVDCNRAENQMFRRDPSGKGGSTVSVESDLRYPDPDPACVSGLRTGLDADLSDCTTDNGFQRFNRTAARQLAIAYWCLDAGAGLPGTVVKLAVCNQSAAQEWNLVANGELRGLNGLCLTAPLESNANGNKLVMRTCEGVSVGQRWSFRDPR